MQDNKMVPCEMDSTLALCTEGYHFIKNRMDRYHTDVFETRLLGKKVICISGSQGAKIFYNPDLFEKKGALPKRVQKTLFGLNGVQTLDGEKHAHRKMFFMKMLDEEQQKKLTKITKKTWNLALKDWENSERIVLYDEVKKIICQSTCEWAGIPLPKEEIECRANDFGNMVFGFGAIGPKYWMGKCARKRAECWMRGMIEDTRTGKLRPPSSSALFQAAFFKDLDGKRLEPTMAAIELINIVRPIVAISIYIAFTALALFRYKDFKLKLMSGDKKDYEMFAQEVRRYYPLTPFLAGIVKKNFMWKSCKFSKGTLVLLDVYGINHDERTWKEPYRFNPNRFKGRGEHLYDFIPQGGGEADKGHRCPGEGITIELMKVSIDILLNKIEYRVPKQNLKYSLRKMPTLPKSGFIISKVKRKVDTK